jgi:MFS family permease
MKPREQQAWVIASSLFVSLFFLWGGCYNTSPVFVGALLKAFPRWSHAQVALIPSTLALSVGCVGPVAGWLLDRFEARVVMPLGAALVGIGLIGAGRAATFAELLAANVLIGAGLGASAWLPASVVIANWFGERRGTALGVATAGMESGGMVMTFVLGYIIARYRWNTAYFALSLPIWLLVLPLLITVVRTRPRGEAKVAGVESPRAPAGYEVASAIKTPVFWLLVVVQFAWGFSAAGVFIHFVAYLMGLGYSLRFATTVLGVFIGLAAAGKPTMGALGDRIGGKNALGIALFLISASILMLLGATRKWVFAPYLVLIGVSGAAPAALVPFVLSETLGLRRFGTLYGWIQLAVTIGFFTGPLITGKLYDMTHSYTNGFELAAAVALIGSAASFFCTKPRSLSLALVGRQRESAI